MATNINPRTAVRTLTLKAPLSGYLVAIERVPDPVFAQKMVGDGIAIDPISESLLAPCDGEVVMLHPANHALTLATAEGIEVQAEEGRSRVVIEGVAPEIACGQFPIRRIAGDIAVVEADVVSDGHDAISCVLQYRWEVNTEWTEVPIEPPKALSAIGCALSSAAGWLGSDWGPCACI